jgi:hypothetical protein
MSFKDNPSPDYINAVSALKKLGLDDKTRAFADAAKADLERQITQHAGRPVKVVSWRRLLDQEPRTDDSLPADDHVDLRLQKERIYTSHPYHLRMEDLRQIVKICDENEIDAEIDARSWYFPGGTVRVSYRPRRN